MKLTKGKIIAAVVILALLAAAFFLGGRPAAEVQPTDSPAPRPTDTVSPTPGVSDTPTPTLEVNTAQPETAAPSPAGNEDTADTPTQAATPSPTPAAPSPSPVPSSAPTPTPAPSPTPELLTCTLSIRCDDILENMDNLTEGKAELVPADGWILYAENIEFSAGDSVLDILVRELKERKIQLDYTGTSAYGTAYVEGIANLYEFDCGPTSGWTYYVNGNFLNIGCSAYTVAAGDSIAFVYSCSK